MPAIDAHIHLDLYNEADIAAILDRLPQTGVEAVVAVSLHLASCRATQTWKRRYPGRVVAAYGYHPEQAVPSAAELDELLAWMTAHAAEAAAIGEIGLPYYSRKEAESKGEPFELAPYIELLDKQLLLAHRLDKPVVLHAVYEDATIVCDLLERRSIRKAHFHWFKGPQDTVRRMIAAGYYISITPDVHDEPDIRELVRAYPLELMMVETDGPWPYEGAYARPLTEPAMVLDAIRQIAALKGLSPEETAAALYANTRRFYALDADSGLVPCPGCGAKLPDNGQPPDERYNASAACLGLSGELAAYHLELAAPDFPHQMAVDAYGAQHAGAKMKPIRTAFSLIGLYLALEKGYTGKEVQRAHMQLAGLNIAWPQLEPLNPVYTLTIRDVLQAAPGEARAIALHNWADDVWRNWEHAHDWAQQICAQHLQRA